MPAGRPQDHADQHQRLSSDRPWQAPERVDDGGARGPQGGPPRLAAVISRSARPPDPPGPESCSNCGVGSFLNIMPNGDVFPCHVLTQREFRCGNVREDGLLEICRPRRPARPPADTGFPRPSAGGAARDRADPPRRLHGQRIRDHLGATDVEREPAARERGAPTIGAGPLRTAVNKPIGAAASPCTRPAPPASTARCPAFVFTGDPGSGKSALGGAAAAIPFAARWLLVPEAAPLLFQESLDASEQRFQVAVVRCRAPSECVRRGCPSWPCAWSATGAP